MSDKEIIEAARQFAETIMASDTYKEYLFQREKIKKQPGLYEKVNEFRQRNFDLQNETDGEELFDRVEAFEMEYEKFRENPFVDDFLRAELAFCRMMQDVYVLLAEDIDFEYLSLRSIARIASRPRIGVSNDNKRYHRLHGGAGH